MMLLLQNEVRKMENKMCLNEENYVVMSNDLIKGKSNLSLNELKLLRLTIMQIMREDIDLLTYQISIVELAKCLGIARQNLYVEAMEMCKHLMQELVFIGDGNPKHKWEMFQWCSKCRYNDGIITIKLHDDLKPYLLELKKHYTQYVLQDILLLKTVYSVRMYELISEELRTKVYADKTETVNLSIEKIRKATNTEDKYETISMFRSRVIDSAIAEINEKLGYNISYEPIKKSRKIVGYKFIVESKNNIQ